MRYLKRLYDLSPRAIQDLVPPLVKKMYSRNTKSNSKKLIGKIYSSRGLPNPELDILIIGARYGPFHHLENIKKIDNINIIGIEPDSREYNNLTRQYSDQTFHQVALGDRNGEETLYITNHPGKSSIYKPNINLLKKWKYDTKKYDIERTQKIETTTLDDFVSKHDYEFDFIQIDTQGSEGDIISGGEKALQRALAINLEQNIIERYNGIATFWEIHSDITDIGFELILSSEFSISAADTYYFRQDYSDSPFKYILLALLIDYPRFAYYVLQTSEDAIPNQQFELCEKLFEKHLPDRKK